MTGHDDDNELYESMPRRPVPPRPKPPSGKATGTSGREAAKALGWLIVTVAALIVAAAGLARLYLWVWP